MLLLDLGLLLSLYLGWRIAGAYVTRTRGQTPAARPLGHTAGGTLRCRHLGVSAADANARHGARMKVAIKLVAGTHACYVPRRMPTVGRSVCARGPGAFLVTVFVAPEPARAGPIDTSVLVQDRQTGVVILDAKVDLAVRRVGGGDPEVLTRATREQSTNKVLQSGRIDLPTAGSWALRVFVSRGARRIGVRDDRFPVSPAAPRLAAFWPLLLLPPFAVALFALHQALLIRAR